MDSASGTGASTALDPANQRLLNTYIYDYLVKQSYGDTARKFKAEGGVSTLTAKQVEERKEQGPNTEGSLSAQLDRAARTASEKVNGDAHSPTDETDADGAPGELPQADVPVNVEGGFLAEWWVLFWDMFSARQGRPSTASATTFMAHNQRLKQERQAAMASAMTGGAATALGTGGNINTGSNANAMRLNLSGNPLTASNVDAAAAAAASAAGLDPNGANAQINNKTREALMRQAMMNNGNKGRSFPPTAAQIQQLKTQQYLQQQAQREDSEGLPGQAMNPQSPASMSAPSPSKRQRLSPDGTYAQIPANQRPQPGMPMNQQTSQAHQMLLQAGINPAGLSPQQLAAFQNQPPVLQQKQLSAYVQGLASQQQRAMQQAAKGPLQQPVMVSASPSMANAEGPPAEGNHALQDYQMQLMLLEQQNKKRLLMARQEQERLQQPGDVPVGGGATGFTNSPPSGRPAGSPAPGSIDMPRGTPKMGNQNVPGTPGEQQQQQRPGQQHPMQQQQQIQRNASPAVTGFVPQHGPQDPQQQMMYRQMMQQQQQQQQENGAMPLIMGPGGQMMRVPPQMAGFPPNHPAFQNPQMMQQMMAANGDPRARESLLWQQQQQQQQRQMMQQMHQNGQLAGRQLTPQQQHALAQHHAAQQAQVAQQQQQQQAQQGMQGLGGPHQQMPPPQAPLPMQQAGPGGVGARPGSTAASAAGQPPSPSLSNQNPSTPVQANAKVPAGRKASTAGKETKKQTAAKARKAAAAAAAAAAAGTSAPGTTPAGASEPPTPTTPMTPHALNQQQQQLQQAQQAQQQQNAQQAGHFAHPGQQGDGSSQVGNFMDAGADGAVGNAPGSGGPASAGFDAFPGELNMDLMQDFDFESFLADDPNGGGGGMNFGFNGDDGE
ncbi:hypothetical protein BCR37DRAFT_393613 [Protomyces lactucae-debilis]|uniref:Uncharacterized protein n=1 Tax=Protomyces lactucae-debilis TaxID=2754530 RepID=A0A1Y2FAN3_PROLT|nr:uncharacterized protein BCR37DRAFT_393613 [Protomyces lactucae-debilis]ORY80970.1 hypothetical protein BCR37DRAFT_393613 [Protomyces lactucae-debilis]